MHDHGDNAAAPGVPITMTGLPSRETMVGLMELKGRLPGVIELAWPCTIRTDSARQAAVKSSISSLSRMPVFAAVALWRRTIVQGIGHRRPRCLDCRRSNSVYCGAFMWRDTRFQVAGNTGLVRIDDCADFLGVALVQQAIKRVLHEVRIAQVAIAIDVCMAHGLDLIVHCLRRTKPKIFERITLEDIEGSRTRPRRPSWAAVPDDVIAAVIAFDGRQLAHLVLLQIRLGDESLACGARGAAIASAIGPLEHGRAKLRNQAQGPCQVLLHQSIPSLVRLALDEEDSRGCRVVAKVIGRRGEQCNIAVVQHEAAIQQTDGRRDQRPTRARAVLLPGIFQPTATRCPVRRRPGGPSCSRP